MEDKVVQQEPVPALLIIPFSIALAQFVIQMLFAGNYGYFRDELYYIACSKHLAFGYVDQPPFSILVLALVRLTLGDSLHAIRALPALTVSVTAMIASLTALRLGGGRFAAGLAALCVAAAPVLIGGGRFFSMNCFDVLFWASCCYLLVRILLGDSPKLWLIFGIVAGVGLQNKYSVGFLCIGIFFGLLLTHNRKHLAQRWFWLGALIAALIFLPHLLWEVKNGFPSIEFMRNASQLKNNPTSALEFFAGQLRELNYFNAIVWLAGLYFFFADRYGRQLRALGWMYVIVFAIMIASNGKAYYLSPIYPMLFAAGAVFIERLTAQPSRGWVKYVVVGAVTLMMLISIPFAIPVLPVEKFIAYEAMLGIKPQAAERTALGALPQHYADQFGWEEMVAVIASAYQQLSPEEQAKCVIYVRNYGEAGAVDFFGWRYGLPNALCAHNSYWFWGPGERTGDVSIIIGGRSDLKGNLDDLGQYFAHVELAATTHVDYCMPFEDHRQIFICKGFKYSFQKIWNHERFFI
ncbi:MAG TPA: glycosyltransferase family 39 protein [Bacteroidota bacterium]|nr:glycosyltransferase family 39 protein [Bacteroidota bacterium]